MKILLIAACLINFADDRGGVDHAEGDFADVPKDTANFLTVHGRALYTKKADDHTKDGRYTADAALIEAAEAAAAAKAGADKNPDE
jgi:hypothetical protein